MNTQVLPRSWLGRSSPWLHRFSEAAKLSGVEGIIRPEGALLEQVAVLYQLVDEVSARARLRSIPFLKTNQLDGITICDPNINTGLTQSLRDGKEV